MQKRLLSIMVIVSFIFAGFVANNNVAYALTETSETSVSDVSVVLKRDMLNGTYKNYSNITNALEKLKIINYINDICRLEFHSEKSTKIINVPGDPIIVELAKEKSMKSYVFYSNGWVKFTNDEKPVYAYCDGIYAGLEKLLSVQPVLESSKEMIEIYLRDENQLSNQYFRLITKPVEIEKIKKVLHNLEKCPPPVDPYSSASGGFIVNVVNGNTAVEYSFSTYAQLATQPEQLYWIKDWDLDVISNAAGYDFMDSTLLRVELVGSDLNGNLKRYSYLIYEPAKAKEFLAQLLSAVPTDKTTTGNDRNPVILLTIADSTLSYYKFYQNGLLEKVCENQSLYYLWDPQIYANLIKSYW